MIEIVFGESACGSLKIAQTYGKGKYRGSAVSIFMRHEDGSVPSSDEMKKAQLQAQEQERIAWENLHIDNELVADAFANLPQQEQSILILYCVLDMADGEIASLTGMSRSAVQRHRTKTLKELRVKLMALMPEGG